MTTRAKARPAPIARRPVAAPPFQVENADCPIHNRPVWFAPATKSLYCPSCAARKFVRAEAARTP